jgi:benzoate/toluate 1,2-dioxygenase beta subunit
MSSTLEKPNPAAVQLSPEDVRQFLYREARLLDDKEWENWLALYAPDAEFWMPSWDDDDQLVTDPQTEISLIWYGNKGGLEDRVFRIGTKRSGASGLPEPRTSHNISYVEILERQGGVCRLRFNWVTFSYRHKTVDTTSAPHSTRSMPPAHSR